MRLRLRCPAKVNLHLEVVGRRPDGFHELCTLFAAVGLWDELEIKPAPAGQLRFTVEPQGAVPTGESNLVVRAARLLDATDRAGRGAEIVLHKRIPVAAGLGGGSSDAACALVGLAGLWRIGLAPENLTGLAARLGSDVPFFLVGGAAWGRGRGTELTAIDDLPAWWAVLLPGTEPVPTAQVYARLSAPAVDSDAVSEVYEYVARRALPPLGKCRNDLESVVCQGWPGVGERLAAVRRTRPLQAQVSGSGGTVYGLYPDEAAAKEAASALGDWSPLIAPLLARRDSGPQAWEV